MLDDDGLTIRRYYFPCAGPKHIPYSAIRHVVARRMNSILLVLDVGARVKPCVSPDDPQRVIELLRERAHID